MSWIVRYIHVLMFVSGALTLTMLYAAFAPEAALTSNFGESLSGPVAEYLVAARTLPQQTLDVR